MMDQRRLKNLEWCGAILGLLGAGLLATNTAVSGYGFLVFLCSNACWLVFGLKTRAAGLVVMQVGFSFTSLAGIWRWLA